MRTLSTYRVNTPTTANGHSISITTTIFGTEEEIEYFRKNCAETIGSGLVQEYASPLTSQFRYIDGGQVVPDILQGWRYEEKAKVGELIDAYTKGFDAGVEIARNEKPQGEYTEEDIKQAIKENFDIGYEMAKNKYERPKGEWRPKTDFDGFTYCVCSSCNWLNYGDELNFCPNCGAKMKGD